MLYIIYCKPDKEQGKKEFIDVMEKEFGVIPIKKFTSKPQNQNRDRNLISVGDGQNLIETKDEFIRAVNEYCKSIGLEGSFDKSTLYIYERVKGGDKYYYGISRMSVMNAMTSTENYALVCTNIERIIDIKTDAKQDGSLFNGDHRVNMYAYCLVRQGAEESNEHRDQPLTIGEIKALFASNAEKDMPKWLEQYSDDAEAEILPYGEARELDFFRYIEEFSNLLIIPTYKPFEAHKHEYVRTVCEIIEKYIGLKRLSSQSQQLKQTQVVFVVHPFGEKSKFKIDENIKIENDPIDHPFELLLFKKLIHCLFNDTRKYELHFADQMMNESSATEGSFDLNKKICERIEAADIVVVDLSNVNHNCVYELGYARALGKKVLPMATSLHQEAIEKLLFDQKSYSMSFYNPEDFHNNDNLYDAIVRLNEEFGKPRGEMDEEFVFKLAQKLRRVVTLDEFKSKLNELDGDK